MNSFKFTIQIWIQIWIQIFRLELRLRLVLRFQTKAIRAATLLPVPGVLPLRVIRARSCPVPQCLISSVYYTVVLYYSTVLQYNGCTHSLCAL